MGCFNVGRGFLLMFFLIIILVVILMKFILSVLEIKGKDREVFRLYLIIWRECKI